MNIGFVLSIIASSLIVFVLLKAPEADESNYWGRLWNHLKRRIKLLSFILAIPILLLISEEKKTGMVKFQLNLLHISCKRYWKENGNDKNCPVGENSLMNYGYRPPEDFRIIDGGGNRSSFFAEAENSLGGSRISVDAMGNISTVFWSLKYF